MGNFDNLKAIINANIRPNGREEITGLVLNSVLIDMVDVLGESADDNIIEVLEDGLFFVDNDLYIGAYIDETGIHAPNIQDGNLDYEIV